MKRAGRNLTILLVEDDEIIRSGMTALLELMDHVVIPLAAGEGVVAAVEAHQPDVVVLDLGLPGIAGGAVFEDVRTRWRDLPVIFSTGASDHTLHPATDGPGVRTLVKPYDFATLLHAIDELREG